MNIRVGMGFDVHELESGKPFYLGGIELKEATKGLENEYQAHHIVEQKVLKHLGHDTMISPAVVLTAQEHIAISKELDKLIEPGQLEHMSKKEILQAYEKAYANHPAWLTEVRRYF